MTAVELGRTFPSRVGAARYCRELDRLKLDVQRARGERCPKCGRPSPRLIVYGFPSEEMEQARVRGEILLGGCRPLPEDRWCPECSHEWIAAGPG
jgi:hypothetical protein